MKRILAGLDGSPRAPKVLATLELAQKLEGQGLDRLLGTTAAKIVNHADRAVLVVR